MYWKNFPKTTEKKYISGYEALNIPDGTGNVADWHPRTYLSSINPDAVIKTYELDETIGNVGINYKAINFPYKAKVHIANYVRAIIDLIIFSERDIEIKALYGCRHDFLTDKEEIELFEQLIEIIKKGHEKSDKIVMFLENEYPKKFYEYKRSDKWRT